MNRRLSRIALAAGVAGAALLSTTASAFADTTVMGSTLANDFEGGVSTAPTVSAQYQFEPGTSPNPVVSPANGLITGWKVKSADDGALYTLKVLRLNGALDLVPPNTSNFTAITSVQAPSAVPAGTAVATPTGKIFDYPASLPISKGDYIGLLTGGEPLLDDLPQNTTDGLNGNVIGNNFGGQPTDGTSADLIADVQHDLLLQATVKYCAVPNLKKLKTKAAVQALQSHDCGVKKKKSKTKKKKFRGKVLKQKTPAGTTAAPGTVVPIVIGKKT
jgi:PASTA domain